MKTTGFEAPPPKGSDRQGLWVIFKFCTGLLLLGIWLVMTPLAFVAYHGDTIMIETLPIPAEWGVIGMAGFCWFVYVWPLLRSFRN